jgi:magnesium transporter
MDPAGQLRVESLRGVTAVVIWLPAAPTSEAGLRVLALVSDHWVLTASPQDLDLQQVLAVLAPPQAVESVPFSARITYLLLTLTRERFAEVACAYLDQIRDLEIVRLNKGGPDFLQRVFGLQREISTTSADLWRVKGIVGALATGKAVLPGVDTKNDLFLDNLSTETAGLYKEFEELKDALKTLMELHINVRSFEMNKFMRLLAVVSFLGLIPSVVGGLFGMNVEGNPWPVTLGQVAFGVVMSMATSLYVFAIKGWLR